MCGEIRNIESAENLLRGFGIVIGRPTHQRKSGQGHDRIDGDLAVLIEKGFDCGTSVEPSGERRDDAKPPGLEGGDDAVIVRRIA